MWMDAETLYYYNGPDVFKRQISLSLRRLRCAHYHNVVTAAAMHRAYYKRLSGVWSGAWSGSVEWSVEWSQKWSEQWSVEWSVDQIIALGLLKLQIMAFKLIIWYITFYYCTLLILCWLSISFSLQNSILFTLFEEKRIGRIWGLKRGRFILLGREMGQKRESPS